jgi:hypothetical protein
MYHSNQMVPLQQRESGGFGVSGVWGCGCSDQIMMCLVYLVCLAIWLM